MNEMNRLCFTYYRWVILLLLFVVGNGCQDDFRIEVRVEGGGNESMTVLTQGNGYIHVDSIPLVAGKAVYTPSNDSVSLITFFPNRLSEGFPLFRTEKGRVELIIPNETGGEVVVKGSDEGSGYYRFRSKLKEAAVARRVLQLYMDSMKLDSMEYYQRLLSIDTLKTIDAPIETLMQEHISSYPRSPYTALALSDFYTVTGRYGSFYSFVKERALESPLTCFLYPDLLQAARRNMLSFVDYPFPNFSYYDVEGKFNTINSARAGVNVLLLFFDPNDPYHCFLAKQHSDLSERFKEEDVRFLSIAITPEQDRLKHVADSLRLKNQLGSLRVFDDPEYVIHNEAHQLPRIYYISRSNNVQFENVYGDSLRSLLESYFPFRAEGSVRKKGFK